MRSCRRRAGGHRARRLARLSPRLPSSASHHGTPRGPFAGYINLPRSLFFFFHNAPLVKLQASSLFLDGSVPKQGGQKFGRLSARCSVSRLPVCFFTRGKQSRWFVHSLPCYFSRCSCSCLAIYFVLSYPFMSVSAMDLSLSMQPGREQSPTRDL